MFSFVVKCSRRIAAVVCFVAMLGLSVSAAPSLFEEFAERIEGSPFQIFSVLSESLRDGVSAVEADWVSWRNDEESFTLRFYSNMNDHEYALIFEMIDRWDEVDFDLFLNTERIAVSSSYFGEDALGLRFATFADDLPVFFEGLLAHGIVPGSPDLLEEILGYVDFIQELLASGMANEVDPLEFLDLLLPLLLQVEQSSEQVVVNAGGTNVNADRLAFTIDIDVFFDTVFEVLYVASGDAMFDELRRDMQQDMENVNGTITVAVYIADTGRLLQIGFDLSTVETRINWWTGEEETGNTTLSIIANFGAHATDTWLFTIDLTNIWRSHSVTLAWEISEPDSDSIEHRLVISMLDDTNIWRMYDAFWDMLYDAGLYDDFWDDEADNEDDYFWYELWNELWNEFWANQPTVQPEHVATIGMLWNRTSGELVFFYEDENGREDTSGIIASILTLDTDGFILQISDSDFNFEASATVGISVPSVDFINLDHWAEVEFVRFLVEDMTRSRAVSTIDFNNLNQWDDLIFDFDFDWDDFDWDRLAEYAILTPVAQLPTPSRLSIPIPPMPVTLTPPVAWQADPAITIEGPIPTQNTATVIRDLNLRRGPGVSYEAFNHVLAGDTVVVLEIRGGWVKVETDRGTGWVFGRYLDK